MHHPVGPAWAQAVEHSGLGVFMRESLYAYPAANLVHILGVALLVGPMLALDLRLLGMGRRTISAEGASRFLTPIAITGLVLMFASGPLLFAADAGPLALSPVLQLKMALLALALLNALAWRLAWGSSVAGWDTDAPVLGRLQALASALLWLTIAACGRLIAYF